MNNIERFEDKTIKNESDSRAEYIENEDLYATMYNYTFRILKSKKENETDHQRTDLEHLKNISNDSNSRRINNDDISGIKIDNNYNNEVAHESFNLNQNLYYSQPRNVILQSVNRDVSAPYEMNHYIIRNKIFVPSRRSLLVNPVRIGINGLIKNVIKRKHILRYPFNFNIDV